MRYLFGLHPDPYMFHQANMRQDVSSPFPVPYAGLTRPSWMWEGYVGRTIQARRKT